MAGKTFAKEFEEAVRRLDDGSKALKTEVERVHKDTVRDKNHAFSRVDIPKPEPWKNRTDLTL